jgi:hypothetical protein|tara:strand:+ start:2673 stop:2918 length:246 start_codon:yes stop_codon:yes gene_type:complete
MRDGENKMRNEFKKGQLIKIPRGGLEGTTVILLDHNSKSPGQVNPKLQIWDVYIVHSPSPFWKPGEKIGIRGWDMVNFNGS